jgi:hypothetical protein
MYFLVCLSAIVAKKWQNYRPLFPNEVCFGSEICFIKILLLAVKNGERCTDKKENKIVLIYEEIQMGSGAKSHI